MSNQVLDHLRAFCDAQGIHHYVHGYTLETIHTPAADVLAMFERRHPQLAGRFHASGFGIALKIEPAPYVNEFTCAHRNVDDNGCLDCGYGVQ